VHQAGIIYKIIKGRTIKKNIKLLKGVMATKDHVLWDTVSCITANFAAGFEEPVSKNFTIVRLSLIHMRLVLSNGLYFTAMETIFAKRLKFS
jgi:hypothetical protein